MFAHIYFLYHPEINKGGLFGYEYWSVFFASLMYPVLFFVFAYLLQRVTKVYINDKKGKRYSNIIIGTLYFFSAFYFLITFFPYSNSYNRIGLNPFWYYIAATISSISVVLIIMYLPEHFIKVQQKKLRFALETLLKFCLNWRWKLKGQERFEYTEELFKTTKKAGISK